MGRFMGGFSKNSRLMIAESSIVHALLAFIIVSRSNSSAADVPLKE